MPLHVLASAVQKSTVGPELSSVFAVLNSCMYLSYAVGERELKEELGSWAALGHLQARWGAGWVESLSETLSRCL